MNKLRITLVLTLVFFLVVAVISILVLMVAMQGKNTKRQLIWFGVFLVSSVISGTTFYYVRQIVSADHQITTVATDEDDESDATGDNDEDDETDDTEDSDETDDNEYTDIEDVFDLDTITDKSDSDLTDQGSDIKLNNFNIVDLSADKMGQWHLLLSPDGDDEPYFLVVFDKKDSKEKFVMHDSVNVYGSLNGSTTINESQVKSGISSEYFGEKTILLLVDKVTKN